MSTRAEGKRSQATIQSSRFDELEQMIALAEEVHGQIETLRGRSLRATILTFIGVFILGGLTLVSRPLIPIGDAVVVFGLASILSTIPLMAGLVYLARIQRRSRIETNVLTRLIVMIDEIKTAATQGASPVSRAVLEARLTRLAFEGKPFPYITPLFRRLQEPLSVHQNVCLLLGQGGTGKTTLISRVTNDDAAKPEIETILFRLYEHRVTLNERECKIVLMDYRGQDLGVLTRGLLDLEASTKLRRVDIRSLMIILDICDTESGVPRNPISPVPDYQHVQRQIEQWQGQALNAVLGILAVRQLQFALVLVNKIDLLTQSEREEHLPRIEVMLRPLLEKLQSVVPHLSVETMLGSAKGAAAIDIRNKLVRHAATPEV